MKWIIILLIPMSFYGRSFCEISGIGPLEARVCAIKYKHRAMNLCGYSFPSYDKFMRKIVVDGDTAKATCLESKDAVLETEFQTRKTEENTDRVEFDNLKTFFKGYACNTLGAFNSRVCRSLKLKYNKR